MTFKFWSRLNVPPFVRYWFLFIDVSHLWFKHKRKNFVCLFVYSAQSTKYFDRILCYLYKTKCCCCQSVWPSKWHGKDFFFNAKSQTKRFSAFSVPNWNGAIIGQITDLDATYTQQQASAEWNEHLRYCDSNSKQQTSLPSANDATAKARSHCCLQSAYYSTAVSCVWLLLC